MRLLKLNSPFVNDDHDRKRQQRMEVKFCAFQPTISMQRDLREMRVAAYHKWAEENAKQKELDEKLKITWLVSGTGL